MIECKFTLDLSKNGIQKTVHAKAGEQNARKLIITLTQSGNVYDITNHTAEVYFESNTYSKAEIVGNTVEYVLPDVLEEGVRICELKIYRGTQVIFSPMFELIVEKSIGHTAEAMALGKEIHYQKDLADAAEKSDAMQDEDYVVVYDYDSQTAMRLPWSKVKEILIVNNHSSLEGRDAENQHPIRAIEGLQDVIDEFGEAVEDMSESISENAKAQHTHLSAITGEDNLYVLEAFSESADLRPAYFGVPLAFASDVNGVGLSEEQAEILDKLGESEGNLTYDGKVIGGSVARATAQKEFTQDDTNFTWVVDGKTLYILFFEEDVNIPIGTEIADVEFMFAESEKVPNGVYISLFDMFGYGRIPYIPINKKVYADSDYGYVSTAIYFPEGLNAVVSEIDNFTWTSARITYYTD